MGDCSVNKSQIVLESSLQVFFFDLLQGLNKKSTRPLSNETIFYSSLVMDQFGESEKFFEEIDGKIREKVLGTKLLTATHMGREQKKSTLKDVAETSLIICGYFSDSLNRKIIDTKYYQDLGMMAYAGLNSLEPKAYDVPAFYKQVAKSFSDITMLMNLAASKSIGDRDQVWLISKSQIA
jgi:hypothetical protein